MEVFKDYANYYDMFYGDKKYDKEAKDISVLLDKYDTINGNKILNFGCGTGRHDIELISLGYQVDGIDISSVMIDIAKKNNERSTYYVADIRDFRTDKKYEIAIALFHVISYQNKNQDVINSFKTVNKILEMNGLFIFDAWYGPGVLRDLPTSRIKKVENQDIIAMRYAEPLMHANTNIVDVNYEVLIIDKKDNSVKSMKEQHNMRYFFRPEVEEYLYETGFELITLLDCNKLEHPTFESWTVYFVARKIRDI